MFSAMGTQRQSGGRAGTRVATEPQVQNCGHDRTASTTSANLPTKWDPRDFEWNAPVDEDIPWDGTPDVPSVTPVHGDDGRVQIVPRAVHEQIIPPRRRTRSICILADASPHGRPTQPQEMTTRSCSICFSDEVDELVAFSCDRHFFCLDCTARYFQERLSTHSVPKCPAEACGAAAKPETAQRLLAPEEFDKFLLANLRATNRVFDCPGCKEAIYVEESACNVSSESARCGQCSHRICVKCGSTFHPRSECLEARLRVKCQMQRAAFKGFEEVSAYLGLKRCPQCAAMCEKSDPSACDHMICLNCGHHFCWICMADRKLIAAHGNHFHSPNPRCDHYRKYKGPAEFIPNKCERCRARGRACTPPRG